MAARIPMRNAIERCGFNQATAQYFVDQGFEQPSDLLLISVPELRELIKNAQRAPPVGTAFTVIPIKKLLAFRQWTKQRTSTGDDVSPAMFTVPECAEAVTNLVHMEERDAAEKELDVTKADPLKSLHGWFKFNEKLLNYLSQIRGLSKAPMKYLIRDEAVVTANDRALAYATVDDRLIATTLHAGEHYLIDNKRLFNEIKALTVDGPGWTYIKRYDKAENGRAAYIALKQQCEGNSAITTRKMKAYNMISSAKYSGERKSYNFSKYIEAHQEGYNEIIDCDSDEAIPEAKRVRDFLSGIIDPTLQNGIDYILGNQDFLDSFEKTQQYLGTLVANRKGHAQGQHQEARKVASVGRKLEDRWYDDAEWKKLTKEEQAEVSKMAKARKNKKKNQNKKRKAAALKKSNPKGKTASRNKGDSSDSSDEEDTIEPMKDRAGDQFGKSGHNKKQKTSKSG
jgi:hypothetical protein